MGDKEIYVREDRGAASRMRGYHPLVNPREKREKLNRGGDHGGK